LSVKKLTFYITEDFSHNQLRLGHKLNLQTLCLVAPIVSQTADYLTFVFANVLAPKLQQIRFILTWKGDAIPEWSDWVEVDHILGSKAFDSLCNVKITLRSHRDVGDGLIKHFNSLNSKGIIEVKKEILGWLEL
jgi:hypothetical protein